MKKYLGYIPVILATILITLVLSNIFTKQGNEAEKVVQKERERYIVDSMNIVQSNALSAQYITDAAKWAKDAKKSEQSAAKHAVSASKQHVTTQQAEINFKNDTSLSNCKKIVESQKIELAEKDSIIENLANEAEEYSKSYNESNKAIVEKDKIILSKDDQLNSDKTVIEAYKKEKSKNESKAKFSTGIRNVIIAIETALLIFQTVK
jgi:hypothetical protein